MSLDRRELGAAAEEIAAGYLAAHGAEILERNYRRRLGELDVIAREGDTLLIVEVRTRSTSAYGGAAASIDGRKRRRIVRAAQQLLQQRRTFAGLAVRFDVVVVSNAETAAPTVEWIRHAFSAAD
ncbi:MAG TPA: YraN family protein [Steroidobacteraceae bacterium]|nr:YraN family protein [Steroidobacteraceae bacterium]